MTDPLAGMTREEAREFVETTRACVGERPAFSVMFTNDEAIKLLALAALGAECVGARRIVTVADHFIPHAGGGTCTVPGTTLLVLKEDKPRVCDFTDSHVCQYPEGCLCHKEDR